LAGDGDGSGFSAGTKAANPNAAADAEHVWAGPEDLTKGEELAHSGLKNKGSALKPGNIYSEIAGAPAKVDANDLTSKASHGVGLVGVVKKRSGDY